MAKNEIGKFTIDSSNPIQSGESRYLGDAPADYTGDQDNINCVAQQAATLPNPPPGQPVKQGAPLIAAMIGPAQAGGACGLGVINLGTAPFAGTTCFNG